MQSRTSFSRRFSLRANEYDRRRYLVPAFMHQGKEEKGPGNEFDDIPNNKVHRNLRSKKKVHRKYFSKLDDDDG